MCLHFRLRRGPRRKQRTKMRVSDTDLIKFNVNVKDLFPFYLFESFYSSLFLFHHYFFLGAIADAFVLNSNLFCFMDPLKIWDAGPNFSELLSI